MTLPVIAVEALELEMLVPAYKRSTVALDCLSRFLNTLKRGMVIPLSEGVENRREETYARV